MNNFFIWTKQQIRDHNFIAHVKFKYYFSFFFDYWAYFMLKVLRNENKEGQTRTRARNWIITITCYLFNYISFWSSFIPYSTNFYNQYLMFVFFIIFLLLRFLSRRCAVVVVLWLISVLFHPIKKREEILYFSLNKRRIEKLAMSIASSFNLFLSLQFLNCQFQFTARLNVGV